VTLLDGVAEGVQRILAVLPPGTAAVLSIPVLFLVVLIGSTLFVRKLLHPLGRAAATLVGGAAVLIGALVLLPEVAVAVGCRRASTRPPAVVYSFGDAIASGVAAIGREAQAAAAALHRVSGLNFLVVLVLVVAWIWLWNYNQCPEGPFEAAACTRPVGEWWAGLDSH